MRDSSLSQFCHFFAQALRLIFIETRDKGTFLGCRVRWRNAESKFFGDLWMLHGQSPLSVFRTWNLWKRGLYEPESSPDMKLIVLSIDKCKQGNWTIIGGNRFDAKITAKLKFPTNEWSAKLTDFKLLTSCSLQKFWWLFSIQFGWRARA